MKLESENVKKFRNYKLIANLSSVFIFTTHFILLSRFAGVLKELQPFRAQKNKYACIGYSLEKINWAHFHKEKIAGLVTW